MAVEISLGENGSSYKIPNPMTYDELIAEGKSPEVANRIMHEKVFGVNYAKDPDGKPIENGLGSPLNPTKQHLDALRIENERKARSGQQSTTDANVIAAAVAAGVKAGLAAAKEDF